MNKREEIIKIAKELFNEKGYKSTSVNEIIEKANIAKGTFYHYFKSKDDILQAFVNEVIEDNIKELEKIVYKDGLTATEKFQKIRYILSGRYEENYGLLTTYFSDDPEFIYEWLAKSMNRKAKLVEIVLKEGIEKGEFQVEYTLEISEFITNLAIFWFDPSFFNSSKEVYIKRLKAFEYMLEKLLSAEKGSLSFISKEKRQVFFHDNK